MAVAAIKLSTTLRTIAVGSIDMARQLAQEGYETGDMARVRDAAAKAWFGVVQATDSAMGRRGLVPEPGAMAQITRREFLKESYGGDVAKKLDEYERLLRGRLAYYGEVPERKRMTAILADVAEFVRRVTGDD